MSPDLDWSNYLQFIAALLLVIGLIVGIGWAAKRFNLADRLVHARQGQRLAVVEQLPIDAQNRLAVVRFDNREHLILIQRQSATLIDSSARPKATSTASTSISGAQA
jgi:flagellar biosynthetic protein FliO